MVNFLGVWGNVPNPTRYADFESGGLAMFISNIIRLAIVIAGLYAVINFILAGYGYLSASGDPKKASAATEKIWLSILGLLIVVGSFVIGGIVSNILFGDPAAIFQLNIIGPAGSGDGTQGPGPNPY